MDFFKRNGTMQNMFQVGQSLGQAKSDNAFDRIQGMTGMVAKILALIGL